MKRFLATTLALLTVGMILFSSYGPEPLSGASGSKSNRGKITLSNDRITIHNVAGSGPRPARAVAAGSSVIYDNYGAGDSYDTMHSWALKNDYSGETQIQGDPFTPADSDYDLVSIELTVTLISGANELDIWLYDDDGGLPGQVVESFHASGAMGSPFDNNPPFALSSQGTRLKKGKKYWVVAQPSEPNSLAGWCYNNTGDTGEHAQSLDGEHWSSSIIDRGVFRVTGTPVSGGCPIAQAVESVQGRLKGLSTINLPTGPTGLLTDLRRFRDRSLARTEEGRQVVATYYAHSDELKSILANDAALTMAVVIHVSKLVPTLRAASGDDASTVHVDASLFAEGQQLIDRFSAAASPDLQNSLERVRKFVNSRILRSSPAGFERAL